MNRTREFWNDEHGFVVSTELILVSTICVLGLTVGLVEIRNQLVQELGDFAQGIAQLDQSYKYTDVTTSNSVNIATEGSVFNDTADVQAAAHTDAGGITVTAAGAAENGGGGG